MPLPSPRAIPSGCQRMILYGAYAQATAVRVENDAQAMLAMMQQGWS